MIAILHAALVALAVVLAARPSAATSLISPAAGAREAALSGSTVAAPSDLMSAFYQNPAGLMLQERTAVTFGSGFFMLMNHIDAPSGYHGDSGGVAIAPSGGFVVGRDRWRFGIGVFGSVGSKFDFPADPAHGVARNFYTELGTVTIAPTLAYQLTPELSVGVQIDPLFGTLKNRVPFPEQHLRWQVTGPGIQGAVGVLYTPDPRWSFGVSYKTPGEIFMDGTVGVAGDREDLSFDFAVPQEVIFGGAWRPAPRVLLTVFARWADTSVFENSEFEFADTPELNFVFAPESRDVWRGGVGVEFQAHPRVAIRASVGRNQAALEPRSVTPNVYDASGTIFGTGFGINLGKWIVDLTGGYGIFEDRVINANEARVLPGRYHLGGPVVYAQTTYSF